MKKVYVIEDDKNVANLLKLNLELENYQVEVFYNGEDGMKAVEESPPDIILLDLRLPKLDGCEICRRVKSNPLTKGISITVISAVREEEAGIPKHCLAGYICKPFNIDYLLEHMKGII